MKRSLALMVALVSIAGVVPSRSQTHSAPPFDRLELRRSRSIAADAFPQGRLIVHTPVFGAGVGERRIITGRLTAYNRERIPRLQQIQIGCDPVDLPPGPSRVLSTKNHTGPASGGTGLVSIDAHYLFVAKAAGNYRCRMWARSSGNKVIAVARHTYLRMSTRHEEGAQQWSGPPCDSRGNPSLIHPVGTTACRYVVPKARGGFRATEVAIANDRLFAASDAKAVEVFGDLQLTSCYRATGQCVHEVNRFGGPGHRSRAIIGTSLEVYQLDDLGRICASTTDPPRGKRPGVIPSKTHHRKVHHRVVHHLDPGCSSRFKVRMLVTAVSGDPVKIDELISYDRNVVTPDGLPGRAYSNGILRNRF